MAASFTDSFNVAQAAAMCLAEARRSSQVRLPLGPSNCVDAGPTGAPPAWHTLPDEPNEVLGRDNGATSIRDLSLPHAWDTPPEEPHQPLGASSGLAGSSTGWQLQTEELVETLGQSRSMGGQVPAWQAQAMEPDRALSSAPAAEGRRRLRSRATREPLGHRAAPRDFDSSGAGVGSGTRVALGGTLSQDEQRVLVALMMLRSVY